MAIIYTYPVKPTPNDNDLILISDSEDSNKTKQVKISTLPGGSGSGVSSVAATSPLASTGGGTPVISLTGLTGFGTTGQVIKVNSNADGLEWGAAGGNTLPGGSDHSVQYKNGSAFDGGNDLTFHPTNNIFSVKHTVIVKGQGNGNPAGRLKLNCEQDSHAITLEGPAHSGGADYTLKFPSAAPGNTQILQSNNSGQLSWITTPSGGGGGVSQVTAGGVLGTSSGAPISISPTTGNVVVTSQAYAGTTNVGHVPSGGDATKFLRGDATWVIPTNTTYSAGTGLSLNTNTFSLATNAALTNLGGGTGSTFLQKDGTWATTTDTNTNIANTQLQLDDNRTLDFYDGSSVRSLSFIRTNGGSVNMFKFEADGGTAPTFTVGNTESSYEGYVVIEGNGSNRTGQVQFQDAGGDFHTGIKAATTQTADITYTLPSAQGTANSVLTNNGSGALSWTTTSQPAEITSTTAVNSTTFANTPFTFANTSVGSGIGAPVAIQVSSSYGNKHMAFYLGTVFSGSINQSGANTINYATSSDYRLKENVVEMTGSVDRVKQLNPSKFNFIADGPSRTVDGFLAHEVSNIVPEAITGSKDAIDAEGNIIPQGIDQSKLVPLLVGAIKELTARIEALEA